MPSFDVVNRLDYQEVDNAVGNVSREIANRYDFKGSNTKIERNTRERLFFRANSRYVKAICNRK